MFRAIGPVTIVRVNDGFGIAIGVKSVAKLLQLFAQLAIVVNLAVKNNPRGSILIVDRLLSHPAHQLLVHVTTVATNYACYSTHNAHR